MQGRPHTIWITVKDNTSILSVDINPAGEELNILGA